VRREGYEVLQADGGDEALAICESHACYIDLMISDVAMPRMNGRALASRRLPQAAITRAGRVLTRDNLRSSDRGRSHRGTLVRVSGPVSAGSNFGGRAEAEATITMLDLIEAAYDVQEDTIAGGPGWVNSDLFGVIAKVPDGTTQSCLRVSRKA